MSSYLRPIAVIALVAAFVGGWGCKRSITTVTEVRLGYFANVTHAQAVLGVSSGEFAAALKPTKLSTRVFNAGPSLIEALFAGEIDVGYVGPGPTISAFARSHGEATRVIGGSAANGVLIVARKDSGINSLDDLRGKKLATPQLGNTQDIAARRYLLSVLKQADANNVIPVTNAEQLGLMSRGQIDAAWAPEPWASRLIAETGAKLIGEEKDLWPDKLFSLTVVVTTPEFAAEHPEIIANILGVHSQWTKRLQQEPEKYADQLNEAIAGLTGKKLAAGVMSQSLAHVTFTDDPLPQTFRTMAQWSYDLGFATQQENLDKLFELKRAGGNAASIMTIPALTQSPHPNPLPEYRARESAATRGRLVMRSVDKQFANTPVHALRGIDLTCEPGEFVVVVGPSGCGKSTLLNIAAGMIRPDGGDVTLDGQRVIAPGPERAMVFQGHGLFPWLTAAQNIEFGLKMAKVPASVRRERVENALRMVHLSRSGDKLIHELSGGMRQRVAIARSLVMDPAVLLMDEPFAALDAQTRTLLHQQLQELWVQTRKTILFVTHSVGEAVRLADRIIVLHAHPGRIRREVKIDLPHPRAIDSREINEMVHVVRKEIEEEVNRVNAQEAGGDHWKPETPARLGNSFGGLGDGI